MRSKVKMTARRRPFSHKTIAGFAIVEVVIVLVVLGILVVLILNSLQAVQAKARDATRRTEINNLAQTIEECYGKKDKCNGAYPNLSQLIDTSAGGFVATNFANFSNDWLYDSSNGPVQSGAATAGTQYGYSTTPELCTGMSGDTPCHGFTLQAYQETNPNHPYIVESRNK